MAGVTDLPTLLASLSPTLHDADYVFCSLPPDSPVLARLSPLATFIEPEGLSLILARSQADQAGIGYEEVFRLLSLTIHSSLSAVGLTAAVATKLASRGISANVVAAYYHDHILVPADQADAALAALEELSG